VARETGLRIGSFAGAPVFVEPTFLLLAAYVVGSAVLRGGVDALLSALIFVGVIFAAIIIHEFGHAAMAAALKIPSRRIVLTFFGGYVQFERPPKHGWQEIAVSAAGPGANLASYILVASLLPLLTSTLWLTPNDTTFLGALNTFGYISLLLGLFNLLPGFPLDGGHILRAALGYIMQRNTARIVTASIGLILAAALIAYAIWQSLIWTVFIAGLLGLAAWAELRAARYDRQRGAADTTSNA
jgi:Zn-dependent protease